MKRTTPPRNSFEYIIAPAPKSDQIRLRELNEIVASPLGIQTMSNANDQPATRLLKRRLNRQRRFV